MTSAWIQVGATAERFRPYSFGHFLDMFWYLWHKCSTKKMQVCIISTSEVSLLKMKATWNCTYFTNPLCTSVSRRCTILLLKLVWYQPWQLRALAFLQITLNQCILQIEYSEERAATALEAGDEALENTIVINSFSKYHCMTGWRVGWMIVPPKLMSCMVALQQNLFINAPTICQHVAAAAMDCDDELRAHVDRYRLNRDILLTELPKVILQKLCDSCLSKTTVWTSCERLSLLMFGAKISANLNMVSHYCVSREYDDMHRYKMYLVWIVK